jgi:hypothetical protein
MLGWILQISLISIIFIILVHNILLYFKSTLTVPKIKDLVTSSNKRYQDIYNIISKNDYNNDDFNSIPNSNSYTSIDLLPSTSNTLTDDITNDETTMMKDELKSFLKKQLNN